MNNDGSISALDLITIRKLILGLIDEYPSSDSWRFYEKQTNQSSYQIDRLSTAMTLDWVGVKIGDINLDHDPTRSMPRSAESLVLEVPDVLMETGNTYRVSFTAANFRELMGYQFTMLVDPKYVKIHRVDYGDTLQLTDDHFNLEKLSEGVLTTSWHVGEGVSYQQAGISLDDSEVLFSLVIEGVQDGYLSDAFTINSKVTAAEAYDEQMQVKDVTLQFSHDRIPQDGFALYQNRPNPFKFETVIGFYLPEATSATLTIYDATGKLLKVIEGDYSKGYQEEVVQQADLNALGLVYYQLDTPGFTATRKMVLVQ